MASVKVPFAMGISLLLHIAALCSRLHYEEELDLTTFPAGRGEAGTPLEVEITWTHLSGRVKTHGRVRGWHFPRGRLDRVYWLRRVPMNFPRLPSSKMYQYITERPPENIIGVK